VPDADPSEPVRGEIAIDGFYAVDAEWRFVEVNAIAERHFGRTADELRGRNIWEETGRRPLGPDYAALRDAADRREAVRFEAESRVHPGRWFEVHARPRAAGGLDVAFHDVTERRNAEQQLRGHVAAVEAAHRALEQEKRRLEAVLNALPVGVAITDATGGSIQSNAAFEDVWGGPRPATDSVEDYAAYRAWWPDRNVAVDPHEWASALAVETGATVVGQVVEIERFDGTRAFVSNSAAPIRDAQGRIVGSAVAIQDVTAMRLADAAIRESEERYRRLFEHMTEGIFLAEVICNDAGTPVDFRYLAANPALEPLTGLKAAEIVGRTAREVLPGVEDYWIDTYGRAALTGRPERIENFAAPLGRYYSTLAYATRPGQFACLFSDVTDRRLAEEAGRMREAALAEAQRLAHVGSWYWDAASDATTGSDELLRIYGFDPATQSMPSFRQQRERCYAIDDWERVNAAVRLTMATGAPYELDVRVARKEETIWVTTRGEAVRDPDGRIVGLRGTVQDITERKRAEEALREANDRLADADRRKDEFIAILSHELRNPLAPIRYAVPVLQSEQLGDAGGRALAVIDRQVKHLTRLVEDLLDVARITNGKIELRREQVTLRSVVTAALEAAAPAMASVRHTLQVNVVDDGIWLHADAARLTQVLTNLLENSAKYTPSGGQISVEAGLEDEWAVVRVRDTGIGIPADAVPRVFDMFRQVSRSHGSPAGLGIGLAVARRLVQMHGGTIEARSDGPGTGAEFVVRLPPAPATGPDRAPDDPSSGHAAGRRLKVLIVDDNADLVEMLSIVVAASGHEVERAHDGAGAIAKALSWRPDVVLLDVGMPDMSGIEVARQLRRHPETLGTRLVALTGWGQPEDRRRTREAGFDHHLTKPAEPDAVRDLLAAFAAELT